MGSGVKLYSTHDWWLICPTHSLFRHNREACEEQRCLSCTLSHRRPPQAWRYTKALESSLRHVDAFIAPSEFCERKHKQFGLNLPFEHLPHFVPEVAPVGRQEGSAEGPAETPYFLFVGRLEKLKGPQTLIPALRQVPGAELWIAGAGDLESSLRKAAEGAPVRFLGWQGPEELAQLYRGATAVIVPSQTFEMFGLVTLEALQQGTPIIVHDRGALPEIIEASGGGVIYSNETELVEQMKRFLADREFRDRLGKTGQAAVEERWGVERYVDRYENLIRSLAGAS
jgi:glycosyltransferase involved in cell wall biosynthesis